MIDLSIKRLSKVLVAPISTEKTVRLQSADNVVSFWVLPTATKAEIKKAVQMLFKVEVASVQTVMCHGDGVKFLRVPSKAGRRKKAYIRLVEGAELDLTFGTAE